MAPAATKYDDVAAVNKVAAVQAQVSLLSISVYVRVAFLCTHTHIVSWCILFFVVVVSTIDACVSVLLHRRLTM
jgi:hypothetical protein